MDYGASKKSGDFFQYITNYGYFLWLLFFKSSRMPPYPNSTSNGFILPPGASEFSKISGISKFRTVSILFSLTTLLASSSFYNLPLTLADLQAVLWLPANPKLSLHPTSANSISERRYVSDLSLIPAHHWWPGVDVVLRVQTGNPSPPGSQ